MTMKTSSYLSSVLWLFLRADTLNGQITVDPWITKSSNVAFEEQYAVVGETIRFFWPEDVTQNVWIYPSFDCFNTTGRIPVGASSGAAYAFREEDGSGTGNSLFFTSDIDRYCADLGMRLIVTVYSGTSLPPFAVPPMVPVAITSPVVPPVAAPVVFTPAPQPTDNPTFIVTNSSDLPSTSPSSFPTSSPSATPTLPPITANPSASPSTSASIAAPVIATLSPTILTLPPSTLPPDETNMPTPVPSLTAIGPPTVTSTKNITLRGLSMEIFGINRFGRSTQESWESTTAAYSTQYVQEKLDGVVFAFSTVYNVMASTIVLAPPDEGETRRRQRRYIVRGLQQQQNDLSLDSVQITYQQTLIYDTTDPTITSTFLAQMPFDTEQRRQSYITFLNQNSENVALSNVVDSTAVTVFTPGAPTIPPETTPPTFAPTDNGDTGGGSSNSNVNSSILSLPAIIGIACGGGALIVLFIIFCLYCRRNGGGSKRSKKGSNSLSTPPMTVSVSRDDEVSRLHGHKHSNGHGDQRYECVRGDIATALAYQ
jgi:hypothetical protein